MLLTSKKAEERALSLAIALARELGFATLVALSMFAKFGPQSGSFWKGALYLLAKAKVSGLATKLAMRSTRYEDQRPPNSWA